MASRLPNFLAFQFGWFAAVVSAAVLVPMIGLITMMGVVGLHLRAAAQPGAEIKLLLLCGVLGAIWDSVLVAMGWVAYPSGMLLAGFAPYWIVMMWLLFATTLNVSLDWMKGRPWLAAAFGFVGGPLSYLAGQKIGGIILVDMTASLLAMGIGWSIMMPLLIKAAERFNGFENPDSAVPKHAVVGR